MTDEMGAGEKEMRMAFEQVTTNNVNAILVHGNTTRKLVKEMMDRMDRQDGVMNALHKRLDGLQAQITTIQAKLFAGGTV